MESRKNNYLLVVIVSVFVGIIGTIFVYKKMPQELKQ